MNRHYGKKIHDRPGDNLVLNPTEEVQNKIIAFVKQNQPVNVAGILSNLKIGKSTYYVNAKALRDAEGLYSVVGVGVFASIEDYKYWMKNGGAEILRARSSKGGVASSNKQVQCRMRVMAGENLQFAPYNRELNAVVREYMQSEARHRLLMVYGRLE